MMNHGPEKLTPEQAHELAKTLHAQAPNIATALVRGWRTGHCAGCNHEFCNGESQTRGMLIEREGVALYTLCAKCAYRAPRDRKFRRRLESDAYRSLFNAGPDSVGGSA